MHRPLHARAVVLVSIIGVMGWAYLIVLGMTMAATSPPTAGFDLELLLVGARRIAEGQSPYDPSMLQGATVGATSLFYSYPPWVAQALVPLAGLSSTAVLMGWGALASVALVGVGVRIARRFGEADLPWAHTALVIAAIAPFVFPYAIGLLFGNLDTWFPAIYGLLLLGAAPSPDRNARWSLAAAGFALAVASASKLHPVSLGLWCLARGLRDRRADARSRAWSVLAIAVLFVVVIVIVSLLVGGTGPWLEYLTVVRAGAGADLVDARNGAPAVVVGSLVGLDSGGVRIAQALVLLTALAVTTWTALRRDDPVTSLAIAAAASFVTLPVTWYHYPAALIPFGIAALARASRADIVTRRRTVICTLGALISAVAAIAFVPLIWVAVALLLIAVHRSAGEQVTTTS
ncbi:MAG: glycosyltransferase 87 family protein [Candidatus Limnocylindrales bacterium]